MVSFKVKLKMLKAMEEGGTVSFRDLSTQNTGRLLNPKK